GDQAFVYMRVDNVNVDLAEDVRRAVRATAVIFAQREGMKEVRITPELRNTLPHETGYVDYLGVSAIALAAVIAGGVLGGTVGAIEPAFHNLVVTPESVPLLLGVLVLATLFSLPILGRVAR